MNVPQSRYLPWCTALVLIFTTACGGRGGSAVPSPVTSGTASPAAIDSMWVRAGDFYAREKWDDAAVAYERVQLEMRSGDPRIPKARFQLAETRLHQKSNLQAVREFRRVSDDFSGDSLAPIALVRAGDAYAALWRRPELDPTYGTVALATYQEVSSRFPGTPSATVAQAKIAGLEDKFAYKAYRAAEFYVRYKAHDSAVLLLKDLIATYPRTAIIPEALESLVDTYRKLGYLEDVAETCEYFRRFHSESPRLASTCPATTPGAVPTAGGTPGS
ncbi:MAG: outer membrane protein assembly factor BamD [Gemmatimonadales bacterium]|nr:outer membrane protein assembly factor BamD [Gemmatimonadales bacterium]